MLYIVIAHEDGEQYEYEYGNHAHAKAHYNNEKSAQLLEYKDGKHYLIECK